MKKLIQQITIRSFFVLFLLIWLFSCQGLSAQTNSISNTSGFISTDTCSTTDTDIIKTNFKEGVDQLIGFFYKVVDKVNYAKVRIANSPFTGQFKACRKINETVTENEVIGTVYKGGVWNNVLSPSSGTITYILKDGVKARKNYVVCKLTEPSIAKN